jgi:hypothetical protein
MTSDRESRLEAVPRAREEPLTVETGGDSVVAARGPRNRDQPAP